MHIIITDGAAKILNQYVIGRLQNEVHYLYGCIHNAQILCDILKGGRKETIIKAANQVLSGLLTFGEFCAARNALVKLIQLFGLCFHPVSIHMAKYLVHGLGYWVSPL